MFAVAVGDGDNDGNNEVYGVSRAIGSGNKGRAFQFEWNGSSWQSASVSLATNRGYFAVAVGDGDSGVTGNEVYGACDYTEAPEQRPHVYEFVPLNPEEY